MKKKIMTMMLAAVVAGRIEGGSGGRSHENIVREQNKGME